MLSLHVSRAAATAAPAARRTSRTACASLHGSRDGAHYTAPLQVFVGQDADGALCPHSQSTLIALLEKGVPFQARAAEAAPSEFRELFHAVLPAKGAKATPPLLLDGATHLAGAAVANAYLEEKYAGQGAPLMPPDAAARARVRLFADFFAATVLPPYRRVVHVDDPAAVEEAHLELLAALEAVDAFLRLHGGPRDGAAAVGPHASFSMRDADADAAAGGGPYLLGRFYSLAEVAATPFVARLALVLPEWRGFDVIEECRRVGADRVANWMEACLERPSAQRTDPSKAELLAGLAAAEAAHSM